MSRILICDDEVRPLVADAIPPDFEILRRGAGRGSFAAMVALAELMCPGIPGVRLPRPRARREPNVYDTERLAAAEAKRKRKAEKRKGKKP